MAYMTLTDALMNAKRASRMRGIPFSTRNVMDVQSSYMGLGGGAERASARMSSAQDERSLAAQKQNFADTLAQQKSQFEDQQAFWTQQRTAQAPAQQAPTQQAPAQAPAQGPGQDIPFMTNYAKQYPYASYIPYNQPEPFAPAKLSWEGGLAPETYTKTPEEVNAAIMNAARTAKTPEEAGESLRAGGFTSSAQTVAMDIWKYINSMGV